MEGLTVLSEYGVVTQVNINRVCFDDRNAKQRCHSQAIYHFAV
jgi:hypothetical protein